MGAAVRELTWGLPAVAREVRAWRALAVTIPDATIREDFLSSLGRKRTHADGAALFCILLRSRNQNVLRLLVAYEIMWDCLDTVSERGATAGQVNGHQLHLALIEALDPGGPVSDYYYHHPWKDDGGYLKALVQCCRDACRELPSFEAVRSMLAREALRGQWVAALNHELDPTRRDAALYEWAVCEYRRHDATWYELTGAASASLTVHALLVLAARPHVDAAEIATVYDAYNPWIDATTTMLDSYVDQVEDAANGDHSYVSHYPTSEAALERIGQLLEHSIYVARKLPDGERHALIVACMAAMYLSKDSAWTPAMRAGTTQLLGAGGVLVRLMLPMLRLWRTAYAQRST